MKKWLLGISIVLILTGCGVPIRRQAIYTDPSEVEYEIEGERNITDWDAVREAVAVLEKNLEAASENDIETYLSTLVESGREETRAEIEPFFEQYQLEHTILSVEVSDQEEDQMLVIVNQQSVVLEQNPTAEEYLDHVAEAHHTLLLEDGQWLLAQTAMTDSHFIEN